MLNSLSAKPLSLANRSWQLVNCRCRCYFPLAKVESINCKCIDEVNDDRGAMSVRCDANTNANAFVECCNIDRKILTFASGIFHHIVTETVFPWQSNDWSEIGGFMPSQHFLFCYFSRNKPNRNFSPCILFSVSMLKWANSIKRRLSKYNHSIHYFVLFILAVSAKIVHLICRYF